jgi:HlyD family secretion protein
MKLDIDSFGGAQPLPAGSPTEAAVDPMVRQTRGAMGMIALLVFGVFGLAAIFPIEGAVIGSGQVAVESRVKTITHPAGGVLAELRVRDGDRVREGDLLMRLDSSVLAPVSRNAALSRSQLLAQQGRLEAVRDNSGQIRFPAELLNARSDDARAAMAREQQQFALARAEQSGTLALLNQRISQFEQQINSQNIQIDAAERQLQLIEPELEGLRALWDRGLVTINRLNQMERTAVQLTGQIASLQANISQTQAQISEVREQILNVSQSNRVRAATELAATLAQLNDQGSRVAQASDSLNRAEIRAPQDGVVDNLAYSTIGSAVPAGQPLVQIVPDQDSLVVTASVNPADVEALSIGQEARVRFSTLDQQMAPEVSGKLVFVAAERSDNTETGESFYRVRVEIDERELTKKLGAVSVRAGMPVEVFLQTGSRTILSYLVKPILDQLRFALRQ